jgi:perosamine synthetase
MNIVTAGTIVTNTERKYVLDAVNNLSNPDKFDYYTRTFEEEFARYIGTKYAIAVTNGTAALHLALIALRIGKEDEVIVPDLGFVAAANAIKYVGATPVFVDVDPKTWCIDVEKAKNAINDRTKAIMPVYMYGNKPEMAKLKRLGIPLIEDACPAVGVFKAGTYGIGCFSFQGAKTLAIGEGGMVTTNSKAVHDRIRKMYSHGRVTPDFYYDEVGYNYRMSNIQAAVGLAQLKHIDNLVERKFRIHEWYGDITAQKFTSDGVPWMNSILDINPSIMRGILKKEGIDTRRVFPAMSSYPMFSPRVYNPIADGIAETGINIPSAAYLTRKEISHVKRIIEAYYTPGLNRL